MARKNVSNVHFDLREESHVLIDYQADDGAQALPESHAPLPSPPSLVCRTTSTAASICSRANRTAGKKRHPASVRKTLPERRSKSCTPISVSSERICRLKGGCAIFRRLAALVKLRSSATAVK